MNVNHTSTLHVKQSLFHFQVDVGNDSYVHLRVFKTLPHNGSHLELSAIKTGFTKEDSLSYF